MTFIAQQFQENIRLSNAWKRRHEREPFLIAAKQNEVFTIYDSFNLVPEWVSPNRLHKVCVVTKFEFKSGQWFAMPVDVTSNVNLDLSIQIFKSMGFKVTHREEINHNEVIEAIEKNIAIRDEYFFHSRESCLELSFHLPEISTKEKYYEMNIGVLNLLEILEDESIIQASGEFGVVAKDDRTFDNFLEFWEVWSNQITEEEIKQIALNFLNNYPQK